MSIIRAGRTVESGTLADLRHHADVHFGRDDRAHTRSRWHARVHGPLVDGQHAVFDVDTNALDAVLRHSSEPGIRITTATPPTLEELFLRHYGDDSPARGRRSRHQRPMRRADLDGTGRLVRLALRWDRIQLPIWLVTRPAAGGLGAERAGLYPTAEEPARSRSARPRVRSRLPSTVGVRDSAGAVLASQTPLLSPSRPLMEHVARGAAHPTGGGDRPGGDARAVVVGRHAMLPAALLVAVSEPAARCRQRGGPRRAWAAGSRIGRARCRDRRAGIAFGVSGRWPLRSRRGRVRRMA